MKRRPIVSAQFNGYVSLVDTLASSLREEKTAELPQTTATTTMSVLQTTIRKIQIAADCPRLTKFCLKAPKSVEVEFSNGSVFMLPAEYLRIYSPAADSKIRSVGGEKVIYGRRHVGIMSAEPVGNYGVRLCFDDLHKTGIFTWDYLYHLGSNKFTMMRNYIRTLKKHGLSRDPPRTKS